MKNQLTLKTDNNVIQQRITTIRRNEINLYTNKVNSLKKTSQHKGYSLKKRLNSLHSNLQLFLRQLKNRQSLSKHNTAILLHQQIVSAGKIQLEQERIKLQSTNKIHNFTETQLPEEVTNLLNKGTTFIPTQENFSPLQLSRTISSEINSALELIIKKPAQSSYTSKIKSSRNKKRTKPYTKNNPIKLLREEQLKPNFNFHLIDYVHNTISYTKHYLQSTNVNKLIQPHHTNITPSTTEHILKLQNSTDIIITQTDKNMGWALVPISWFTNEYNRHFTDTHTYKLVNNFDINQHVTNCNQLLQKLKSRFKGLMTPDKQKLLNSSTLNNLQIPYMKLLPKVHKLTSTASTSNLKDLTGRPIITAHSWTTSNPSRLLGTELDTIILRLEDLFATKNIHFPLIYNSTELTDLLQHQHISDIDNYCLTTFDFTSLYTKISYQDTIDAIITSCRLLNLPNSHRDFLLNLNSFINNRNFFTAGNNIYQQTQGVAMGSYHSRQIADLVLLISEFNFFSTFNTNGISIFSRYIDDGFMLTNNANRNQIITNLISSYPT